MIQFTCQLIVPWGIVIPRIKKKKIVKKYLVEAKLHPSKVRKAV